MPYDVVAFSTDERAMMLTLEEEGAFHRLLRHAWINGSVPDDIAALARICRCKSVAHMQKLWPALDPFWPNDPLDATRRLNPKQESEREFKLEKSGKAKESAVKRWEAARRAKAVSNGNANGMRTHMPTQSEGNAPLPSPSLLKNPPTPFAKSRTPDPAVTVWESAFVAQYRGTPYSRKKGDFVQLSELRKLLGLNGDMPPDWHTAVSNYLSTPKEKHTLADLCVNYATFRAHPLDRYGKPVEDKPRLGFMPAQPKPVC